MYEVNVLKKKLTFVSSRSITIRGYALRNGKKINGRDAQLINPGSLKI